MGKPENKSSSISKTFIFGLLVCLIFGFFLAIAIPNYPRRRHSPSNACINNLRQIDGATQQWALEHNAKTSDIVPVSQLTNYLYHGVMPKCPSGGVYSLGKAGAPPTCSLPGHILPP